MTYGTIFSVDAATELEAQLRRRHGDALIDKAKERVRRSQVSDTQYGWRVECDPTLGDDRSASGAAAYWPLSNERCLCWYSKANDGHCSHWAAVRLAQEAIRVMTDRMPAF